MRDCQLLELFFWLYLTSSYYSSCRFRSLKLFPLGQQRRLIIRVVDSGPSNYFLWANSAVLLFELWTLIPRVISFWPAAPRFYSNSKSRFHGSLLSGLQHPYVLQGLQYLFIVRGCFHSPPSLCIWAISVITMTKYGHQFPNFFLFGASSASVSIRVRILVPRNPVSCLYLFLFTRILVAIYRFGCRM
jgi:hypothetical protein